MPMVLSPSFSELEVSIHRQYPSLPEYRIQRMNQIAKETRDLVGLRIMDLGSGSVESPDSPRARAHFCMENFDEYYSLHRLDPWFCRFLHEAGAHAIAIDVGDNSTEPFESYTIDLFQAGALSRFPENSIDAVNNKSLTVPHDSKSSQVGTSPYLMKNWMKGSLPTQEELKKAWEFDTTIRSQVHRILKDGGIYVHAEFVLIKQGNEWNKRNTIQESCSSTQ